MSEVDVSQKGKGDDGGRTEPVDKDGSHIAEVDSFNKFELGLSFAVNFFKEVFLECVYFDELYYLKDLLAYFHASIFGFQQTVVVVCCNF